MYSRLLIALPLILAACHLAGVLFRRIGQPAVIGEIIAGVLLGPSLLASSGLPVSVVVPQQKWWARSTRWPSSVDLFMYLSGREIDLASCQAVSPRSSSAR